ncbi:alternative ribosome rescue factor ArfA [Vibrio barjaei]|uniref:alternative ribosome rescue factor ArfA n=1 Tax=Vibrio barjaei TaxID=1676683 RepID=UPI00228420D4|nr:alternative ribosome rescue factor ArfA [Vibrio barjaei]MCY9870441.1 alternative ribosome rescue factor ArfA [Vibrio barjaei]
MAKDKRAAQHAREHGEDGAEIKDSALAHLVRSSMFKMQVVKAKKGKGSYNRKAKYKGDYQNKSLIILFLFGRSQVCCTRLISSAPG